MLDVPFLLETDDDRIASFVRTFWQPFVVSDARPDAVHVSVRKGDGRWELRCEGDPGADAEDPWVLVVVLRNTLSLRAIALAEHIAPLHASVAEKDGLYLALSGPAEAGKTTLMFELLDRGWRYVSDDMAPIEHSSARARPFRKALQVRDPVRWQTTTSRWEVPPWLPRPTKASLVPPTVFTPSPDDPYRPTLLVFSRFVAGAEASYEALSPGEAVALAAKNLQGGGPAPPDLGTLTTWVAAATAIRVVYGTTEEALALLGRGLTAATGDRGSWF